MPPIPRIPIRHKVNVRAPGLKRANEFLRVEVAKSLRTAGGLLQRKVREKQRVDTGQERRRTLVSGVKNLRRGIGISVYNTVIQGLVDETGATWSGGQPPSHPGSKLYKWVQRKGIANRMQPGARAAVRQAAGGRAAANASKRLASNLRSVTFLIARAIGRRGLPRPGDPLRKPFEVTRREQARNVTLLINAGVQRAVQRANK